MIHNRMKISFIIIVMTLLFTLILTMPAFAHDLDVDCKDMNDGIPLFSDVIGLGINDVTQPRVVAACPSSYNGKHHMLGRGFGMAYYGSANNHGSQPQVQGAANQCIYCYHTIISEYNPRAVSLLGNYAEYNPGYQVGVNVIMYTTTFGYNSSLSNYDFANYIWL